MMLQANPDSNDFCRVLVSIPLKPMGRPMILDSGGDPVFITFDEMRGLVWPTGFHKVVTPRWSPDGTRIAYLRRDNGRTSAWIVGADGSDPHRAVTLAEDIDQVNWSRDGQRLVVASRPGIEEGRRSIDAEGRRGWLFDRRVMPVAAPRPFTPGPVPYVFTAFDLKSEMAVPADKADQRLFPDVSGTDYVAATELKSVSPAGWHVTLRQSDPSIYPSPESLELQSPDGKMTRCNVSACADHVGDGWWLDGERRLVFLHREGWANALTALYSWRPGDAAARRVSLTPDVLVGCQPVAASLICLEEGSRYLDRLVRIDTRSGEKQRLFDANPELEAMQLGAVRRLRWKSPNGVEGFGDLVLPPGHRPGEKHPLVIVQYRTRGFLRGGVGDEYPIYALAARGFAVLSFDTPPFYSQLGGKRWSDVSLASREDVRNWNDRRSILESLLTGINTAIAGGAIDKERIGISGLSDGSTTVEFGLINSDLFKAAAASSCCQDPHTFLLLAGDAFSAVRQKDGFPPISSDRPDFWKDYSLSRNVDRIDTPLLIQMSDQEYAFSLETYWALKEHGKPVELYIFPGEFHYKWQPAHKLAIYERSLDWFDYWLQGRIDSDPAKKDQYARWDLLKKQREAATAKP